MKIVVLTGSPNKNGTSFLMADKFIEGAASAGHEIKRFDTAFLNVGFCKNCDYCKINGKCVQNDDFGAIRTAVEGCDLLVFVSPVYYFDFTAQLKKTLDRFHSFGRGLRGKSAKGLLITTCADERPSAVDLIKLHFEKVVGYFHWESIGSLHALGVGNREALLATDYPRLAEEAGKNLKV